MELGSQIRKKRTAKGVSQDELAAKIFVSRQTVSNWETGKTYPDIDSLLLLSVFFDATVDELIKGDLEIMEKTVQEEFKKMSAFSWVGFAVALAGVGAFAAGMLLFEWGVVPSFIIGLLIWGIGMTMEYKAERIRKKYDLATYREILAFSKGETVNRDNSRSRWARRYPILKTVAICAIGALLGWLGMYFGLLG